MNTLDFLKQITPNNNISNIIARFFDEIMILYRVVGIRDNMVISADNSTSVATFNITMNTDDDALALYNNLNDTFFTIYSDKYIIKMQLSGRMISTVIYKAIS